MIDISASASLKSRIKWREDINGPKEHCCCTAVAVSSCQWTLRCNSLLLYRCSSPYDTAEKVIRLNKTILNCVLHCCCWLLLLVERLIVRWGRYKRKCCFVLSIHWICFTLSSEKKYKSAANERSRRPHVQPGHTYISFQDFRSKMRRSYIYVLLLYNCELACTAGPVWYYCLLVQVQRHVQLLWSI